MTSYDFPFLIFVASRVLHAELFSNDSKEL